MSEYWKSTPKYWCKFCSTFVRDTGLERKQHDATPRHQSNIQRSLRTLHKNTEREEREKQRAKDEVARLNGIVGGKSGASGSGTSSASTSFAGKNSGPPAQASAEERKRQMAQLAAMGIAPPTDKTANPSGEARVDGEWSTVSETPIYHTREGSEESKPALGAFGVRKRKLDEDEEEAEAIERKGWGSKFKSYPGSRGAGDDLDALLSGAVIKKKEVREGPDADVKQEEADVEVKKEEPEVVIKREGSDVEVKKEMDVNESGTSVKEEIAPAVETATEPRVVFKKRKGKR